MSASIKKISPALLLIILIVSFFPLFVTSNPQNNLPIVAIANYGPHSSLEETIQGIKDGLAKLGKKEGQQITFEISDVNFEHNLIMQMLTKLKASKPKVIVALSTPVAQAAKNIFKDIPIVFAAITDPVEAGLITNPNHANGNISGSSERQNLQIFISFVKQLLPTAKRIGLLYATGEPNDQTLVKMMKDAANENNMEVVAVAIDQSRDIPLRMQMFKNKVDYIYVGTSGPIQPSLPVIILEADRMRIPVFNADSDAVKKNQALASFGVTYYQVGINAAQIIYKILQGEKIENVPPIYPSPSDHHGFISRKKAHSLGLSLPLNMNNVTIIE